MLRLRGFCHCCQDLTSPSASWAQAGPRSFCPRLPPSRQPQAGGSSPLPGPSVSICRCFPASWRGAGGGGGPSPYLAQRQALPYLTEDGEGGRQMVSRAVPLPGPGWPSRALSLRLRSLLAGSTHPAAQTARQMPFRDQGHRDLVLCFSSLLISELAFSFRGTRKFRFLSAPRALWRWVRIKEARWPSAPLLRGVTAPCRRAVYFGDFGVWSEPGVWTLDPAQGFPAPLRDQLGKWE